MAMATVTAVSTAWTEAPRGASAAVVLQNQSHEEVKVHIAATTPTDLDAVGIILDRLEEKTFRDFTSGHKLYVKSRSNPATVLIWS